MANNKHRAPDRARGHVTAAAPSLLCAVSHSSRGCGSARTSSLMERYEGVRSCKSGRCNACNLITAIVNWDSLGLSKQRHWWCHVSAIGCRWLLSRVEAGHQLV